jgi:hypothetical protein
VHIPTQEEHAQAKVAGLSIDFTHFNDTLTNYYTHDVCGGVIHLSKDEVETNSYSCDNCKRIAKSDHKNRPSHIYLLMIVSGSNRWLKIGKAENVTARSKRYGLHPDAVVTEIFSKCFNTGAEALTKEEVVHNKFKDYKISYNEAKAFGMASGFTECYPVSLGNTLIDELTAIS